MSENVLVVEKDLEPGQSWRYVDDGDVVHYVTRFWDDDYPEVRTRCVRWVKDTPTIGAPAELPAVSCLLCLHAELDDVEA